MLRAHRLLIVALASSLLLHIGPFVAERLAGRRTPPSAQPLQATLRPPPAPMPAAQPPLTLPDPEKPQATPEQKRPPATVDRKNGAKTWQQSVAQQFQRQQAQGLFYPIEAIRAGLEGEPLVLLIIDEQGSVIAARIEESCGHPVLDAAALRAVRALRSLPADAPREVLLPVRFRLR